MTHLVNKGEDIFQPVVVVHKNERIAVIGPEAICSTGLSFVFVNINPAVIYTAFELCKIFFA